MQKRLIAGLVLTLLALSATVLAAESHKFRLPRDARINGTDLKAGQYVIRINGEDQAEILQRGKVVVESEIDLQPLPSKSMRNSVVIRSGQITEIRLNKHLVVIKNG